MLIKICSLTMNGIMDLTPGICAKTINHADYIHYKTLLSDSYVKMFHPKVYGFHNDEKNNVYVVIMEKKGKSVSEYDNEIITDAKKFVIEYVEELHKRELYHGDIIYNGGNGVHLDNVLYDEAEDTFYIIDFNSISSIDLEKKILSKTNGYCPQVLKKRRKNYECSFTTNSCSSKVLFY
jgi:serine/threonine protein kinase